MKRLTCDICGAEGEGVSTYDVGQCAAEVTTLGEARQDDARCRVICVSAPPVGDAVELCDPCVVAMRDAVMEIISERRAGDMLTEAGRRVQSSG